MGVSPCGRSWTKDVSHPGSAFLSTQPALPSSSLPPSSSLSLASMDSLLANYASSDDDEEEESIKENPKPRSSSSSLFSSLPHPKSQSSLGPIPSGNRVKEEHDGEEDEDHQSRRQPHTKPSPLFSSLPQPKSHPRLDLDGKNPTNQPQEPKPRKGSSSPSIFSSLPPPNSSKPSNPKKIVQFAPPPINPSVLSDDDQEEERKPSKDSSSSSAAGPFKPLSSMLPAPKNALGFGLASSSSRISIAKPEPPSVTPKPELPPAKQELSGFKSYDQNLASGPAEVAAVDGMSFPSNYESQGGYENYGSYENYSGYENYATYEGSCSDGTMAMQATEVPNVGRTAGKRGRNEITAEIVEVKQDDLMKNRPREDQAKLTGIAFGPSYQPVSSSKGKPTKLHRRKHQIGSLYYDMKQKESELAERRSKGFLTKAETQAKYGW